MASTAVLMVKILTDASQASKGLSQASGKLGKFQGVMQKAMLPAAAAGAALFAFGKSSLDAASKVEQSMGAVDAVFGKNASTVKKWAADAGQALGLSKSDYADLAATMGAQLKNMGVSQKALAGETDGLIRMGGDLAAQFGGSTADAVAALGSLMRGETDPIEQYGVSIKEADIAAQMAADGTSKLEGAQGKAARTTALMTLLTKQTADAHGALARESDSAAFKQQQMTAEMENAQAAIGAALLPVVAKLSGKFAELAQWAAKHPKLFQAIAVAVGVLVVAIFAINAAISIYTIVTTLAGIAAAHAWVAALGPIGLVIAAIALIVVAIVVLWKRCETFRNVVKAVWNAIKSAFSAMTGFIKRNWKVMLIALTGPIGIAAALIIKNWDKIKNAITAVRDWVGKLIAKIKAIKIPGFIKIQIDAIKTAAGKVADAIQTIIGKIKGWSIPGKIKSALDDIKTAADKVGDVIQDIIGWLKNLPTPHINWPDPPKFLDKVGITMLPPTTGAPALATPAARGRATATAAGGGGGITINVTGAMDPEAVARQINRILAGHDRRVGLRTA